MRTLFVALSVLFVAACSIDPFGTYKGGSPGGTLEVGDGGDDGSSGSTGTIIGGGYDCSGQVAVSALSPSTCAQSDATELSVGTLAWTCAGGGAEIDFSDFTLTGSVTGNQLTVSGSRTSPANTDGSTETVNVSLNLGTHSGQLTYARTLGSLSLCQAAGTLTIQ